MLGTLPLYSVAGGVIAYEWTELTPDAAWDPRDGAGLVYLESTGKYWIVGGWSADPGRSWAPAVTTNQVWSSPDLVTWTLELAHSAVPAETGPTARFVPRHSHGCFLHTHLGTEYIYVINGDHFSPGYDAFGFSPSNGYQSDIWRSSNGTTWERVLESDDAPWAGRMLTVSGSYDGALWVVGGQNGLLGPPPYPFSGVDDLELHNDVYKSTDGGETWTQILADGAASSSRWAPRGIVQKMVSHNGRMWLISGGTYQNLDETLADRMYFAETWSTTDGETWTEHDDPPWIGREYNAVEAFDGRLWLIGGYRYLSGGSGDNMNDVWSSIDGDTWEEHEVTPFTHGHADGTCVGPDGLVHATGNSTLISLTSPVHVLARV
jgi:hypothetical protein